jgi:Carbon starvation protein, predicted membrane protein
VLWRYFAWINQTLAAFTLWAATVYLARHGKAYVITLVPALFMTMVVTAYVLYAPSPEGFGLPMSVALTAGGVLDALCLGAFAIQYGLQKNNIADRQI